MGTTDFTNNQRSYVTQEKFHQKPQLILKFNGKRMSSK